MAPSTLFFSLETYARRPALQGALLARQPIEIALYMAPTSIQVDDGTSHGANTIGAPRPMSSELASFQGTAADSAFHQRSSIFAAW